MLNSEHVHTTLRKSPPSTPMSSNPPLLLLLWERLTCVVFNSHTTHEDSNLSPVMGDEINLMRMWSINT